MPGVRSSPLFALFVCVSWLSACCTLPCPTEPGPPPTQACPEGSAPSSLMQVQANGLAYFVDADPGAGMRHVAKLQIDGGWAFTAHASQLEEVVAAHVFAANGSPDTDELATCANLVYTLPRPPARWSSPWIEGRWDAAAARYRVLVRLVFRSGGELLYSDRTIDAPAVAASNVVKFVSETAPSVLPTDNTSAANCTGTFNDAQNLALYDLDITYDAPVDRIEVYARPANDPTPLPDSQFLVHTEEDPPLRGWHPTNLAGPYDGSPDYAMLIRVYYVSGTPAYTDIRGTYSGIADATPILLE